MLRQDKIIDFRWGRGGRTSEAGHCFVFGRLKKRFVADETYIFWSWQQQNLVHTPRRRSDNFTLSMGLFE